MTDVNPENWLSIAAAANDGAAFDQVQAYISQVMTDLARSEENDLRAALAAWSTDIPGIDDAANIIRVRYPQDQPQVRTEDDASLFKRLRHVPKVYVEVPRLIVLADKRHAGAVNGTPVDWKRHERVYEGERYTVALLDRAETAKIPAATEPDKD